MFQTPLNSLCHSASSHILHDLVCILIITNACNHLLLVWFHLAFLYNLVLFIFLYHCVPPTWIHQHKILKCVQATPTQTSSFKQQPTELKQRIITNGYCLTCKTVKKYYIYSTMWATLAKGLFIPQIIVHVCSGFPCRDVCDLTSRNCLRSFMKIMLL